MKAGPAYNFSRTAVLLFLSFLNVLLQGQTISSGSPDQIESYYTVWKELNANYFDSLQVREWNMKYFCEQQDSVLSLLAASSLSEIFDPVFLEADVSHLMIFSEELSESTGRDNDRQNLSEAGKLTDIGNGLQVSVRIDTLTLEMGIGYIRINLFANPEYTMGIFNHALEEYSRHRGIIIDLRDNPGGNLLIVSGMLGWFFEEPTKIGSVRARNYFSDVLVYPRSKAFKGKIVVLVNEKSQSGAELFASAIQSTSRGIVVGTRTPGSVMLANLISLPNGDYFEYPVGEILSPDGQILERKGVIPNVALASPSGVHELDEGVSTAIQWIKSNN